MYANDPSRRLEIVWQDPATRARPAGVSVAGETSVWTGPNGLSIGDELARVEQLNCQPFKLWGFEWDYGGWVSDWSGGAFAAAANCLTRVRFEATAENINAVGDAEFRSDDARMRNSGARVTEFALVVETGENR